MPATTFLLLFALLVAPSLFAEPRFVTLRRETKAATKAGDSSSALAKTEKPPDCLRPSSPSSPSRDTDFGREILPQSSDLSHYSHECAASGSAPRITSKTYVLLSGDSCSATRWRIRVISGQNRFAPGFLSSVP